MKFFKYWVRTEGKQKELTVCPSSTCMRVCKLDKDAHVLDCLQCKERYCLDCGREWHGTIPYTTHDDWEVFKQRLNQMRKANV